MKVYGATGKTSEINPAAYGGLRGVNIPGCTPSEADDMSEYFGSSFAIKSIKRCHDKPTRRPDRQLEKAVVPAEDAGEESIVYLPDDIEDGARLRSQKAKRAASKPRSKSAEFFTAQDAIHIRDQERLILAGAGNRLSESDGIG